VVIGASVDLDPDHDPDHRARVKLDALQSLPYRLPLRRPWQSARGLIRERQGWLVTAESNGRSGFGDCAPLIEAGTESAADADQSLWRWQERLPGLRIDSALDLLTARSPAAPAARYALECALLDLESRLAGVPMRRWIAGPGAASVPDWIGANAMLGPSVTVSEEAVAEAIGAGYRILKVKVGCADPDLEVARLARLAQGLPSGLSLRLDANGAWDQEAAERVIAALNGLPVESLEEPLTRPDPAGLTKLQALASFPLALDESLASWIPGLGRVCFPVRRAVIKPAVIGGVGATLRLAQRLRGLGIEVVLTGLVDSAAGIWATAQVAAALDSPIPHGLATSDWLAQDLGTPPLPMGGRIQLPDEPGSGFEPDPTGGHRA
jgi:o-succinylbenzoate synthase